MVRWVYLACVPSYLRGGGRKEKRFRHARDTEGRREQVKYVFSFSRIEQTAIRKTREEVSHRSVCTDQSHMQDECPHIIPLLRPCAANNWFVLQIFYSRVNTVVRFDLRRARSAMPREPRYTLARRHLVLTGSFSISSEDNLPRCILKRRRAVHS